MLEKSRRLVFHYIIEDNAAAVPDKPFLVSRERSLTYAGANAEMNRLARGFAGLGVGKGDRVLVMMPSGIDHILVWQALCKLGALMVPINESYRGRMLSNQVSDADAKAAVIAPKHFGVWSELDEEAAGIGTVIAYPGAGGAANPLAGARLMDFAELAHEDAGNLPPAVDYFDPMAILYTSGTTGPSKGVLYGYAHGHATAAPLAKELTPDDVFYMVLPMFHTGLPHVFGTTVISGGTLAIREKFSTSQFWNDVRHFGATSTLIITTMPAWLMSAPESPADRDHPMKKVFMVPMLKEVEAFKKRFGVEVATLFNMTEVSSPIVSGFDLVNSSSCGRARSGIAARVVDENDEPLPPGAVGELVLRSDNPWEFNLGYWRNPEATAKAWRNQWLHTGDLASMDEEGNFYFKDRLKDVIRRRGENISSFELELEVKAHPAVFECAAVPVPSPAGEDEVKVVVSPFPGAQLTPRELVEFLEPRVPAYMVPRYIEICEEIPKTETGKVQKQRLREAGATGWDREAVG